MGSLLISCLSCSTSLMYGLEQNEVQTQCTLGVSRLNAPSELVPCILMISQAILPVRSRLIKKKLACCEVLLHIMYFLSEWFKQIARPYDLSSCG